MAVGRWFLLGAVLVGCAGRGAAGVQTQAATSGAEAPAAAPVAAPTAAPVAPAAAAPADAPLAATTSATFAAPPEPVARPQAKLSDTMAASSHPPPLDVLPRDGVVGIIDRAGLVAIVDAGLGRLFQRVRVAPVLDGGRFKGFRIVSIDAAWSAVPLAPGDVIMRLNGQAIERPEQAMSAFEQLRMAEELVVELTREGVPAELRFRIQ